MRIKCLKSALAMALHSRISTQPIRGPAMPLVYSLGETT